MEKWPKLVLPQKLNESNLSGQVIKISGEDDIKPSLAVINDREMVMFTNHTHYEDDSHFSKEQDEKNRLTKLMHTVMYRTEDGGQTWQCCGHMPFHDSYEASATVIDGVIYVQSHEFPHLNADHDVIIDRIFCSEDKGHSWYETRVDQTYLGTSPKATMCLDRNFVKLKDGSVAGFVSVNDSGHGYTVRLTTRDHGRTWKQDLVEERGVYTSATALTPLLEAFFFRTPKTGRLMAVSRVVWSQFTKEQRQQIPHAVGQDQEADIDAITGMLLLESKDEGLSWDPVRGLGYLGMMYPSMVYLNDEDFVFSYTVRTNTTAAPYPHMGLQAILGKELPDGTFEFDFDHDIIIIDDRTPDYSENGSAYGHTYMLSDGSFITPYSYRINAPVLDELLRAGALDDEEVFLRYFTKTTLKRDHGITLECYRNASYDLRRHLLTIMAAERLESWCKTEVLKWKLEQ